MAGHGYTLSLELRCVEFPSKQAAALYLLQDSPLKWFRNSPIDQRPYGAGAVAAVRYNQLRQKDCEAWMKRPTLWTTGCADVRFPVPHESRRKLPGGTLPTNALADCVLFVAHSLLVQTNWQVETDEICKELVRSAGGQLVGFDTVPGPPNHRASATGKPTQLPATCGLSPANIE